MSDTTIKLGTREVQLRYTNGGEANMQSLPNGQPSFEEFTNPRKAYITLLTYVWACLPMAMRRRMQPADLAEYIPNPSVDPNGAEPFETAFLVAHKEGRPEFYRDEEEESDEEAKEGSVKNDKPGKKRKSASKPG